MINTYFRPRGLYTYRVHIANEAVARKFFRRIRWPLGITCPLCKHQTIWKMQNDYRCKNCNHHFSDTSRTVFEKSHLSISQWILIIGLWKVGVNAVGVAWAVGCTYRIARIALKKIRTAVADDPLVQQLLGEIEIDETYYGGKQKGQRGRGAKNKIPVLGFKKRGGGVKSILIPNVKKPTLGAAITQHVQEGSTIYTDGFRSYDDVRTLGYEHLPHDHSITFIQSPVVHTQGIEGHWGNTKPEIKARHRRITKASLSGYIAESDYKTNHKDFPDFIALVLHRLLRFYP